MLKLTTTTFGKLVADEEPSFDLKCMYVINDSKKLSSIVD